jgi:hypothetical protein
LLARIRRVALFWLAACHARSSCSTILDLLALAICDERIAMLELNPEFERIADMQERVSALRGYL